MKPLPLLLIALLFITNCTFRNKTKTGIDRSHELKVIEQTINSSISWIVNKDTTLLYSIIADDENYLEVHPHDNVVKGIVQFKKAEKFWLDPRFKHVKFETWDMKINLSEDGSVAWFYTMLNDINEWEGEKASWENTRWTGVLEKRNGKWKMVQGHFSYPANN